MADPGDHDAAIQAITMRRFRRSRCGDFGDHDGRHAHGSLDFPYDPGCRGTGDATEAPGAGAFPACADGIDNDNDGHADFPADEGCAGLGDPDESIAGRLQACADGLDNDLDGATDYPADPGCEAPMDDREDAGCIGAGCLDPGMAAGIQHNIPVAALAGWQECHRSTYGQGGISLANLQAGCNGARVVLACRPTGADVLTLMASGERAQVFLDVGPALAASHVHNDVQFYYDDSSSIGFAPVGAPLDRNTCDLGAGLDTEHLCWHTSAGSMTGGFRCGAEQWLNESAAWERIIYAR